MADTDTPADPTSKVLVTSIQVTLCTFAFLIVYVGLLDSDFGLLSWSTVVAGTAGLLFAYSFSLSTLGYYFGFLNDKLLYRKYFGLGGYFLALGYSSMLLLVDPALYLYGFFDSLWSADFILGLGAVVILTMTALVSNSTAMKLLGPQRWRSVLRLGYMAYFLLAVRAALIEGTLWQGWLRAEEGILPPIRLLLFVVALVVILSHCSIYFNEWRKKAKKDASSSETASPEVHKEKEETEVAVPVPVAIAASTVTPPATVEK